jgi:hypothetical protein
LRKTFHRRDAGGANWRGEREERRREQKIKEGRREIPAIENQLGLRRWSLGGDRTSHSKDILADFYTRTK